MVNKVMDDKEFLEQVEKVYQFRNKSPIRAPGVPIGVAMVNLAMEKLGEVKKPGVIAEAKACLSDAIQALTGCTVGNKYLIINDQIGRYALTLYDRTTGSGVRVFVDLKKIDPVKTPEMHKFFLRQRPPEVQYDMVARAASARLVTEEFMACGRNIFSWQYVRVKDLAKEDILPVRVCQGCGESFTTADKNSRYCAVCSKDCDYYETTQ
ncbi:MAG TPA: hypothetical protein DCG57_10955 [Candidatus Riflebacteria bacterium]|jgi:formylmethanofuran dehydrogenase subunit E|nr:hypothetical protein [Candidatus Riflebacteria bacterium]